MFPESLHNFVHNQTHKKMIRAILLFAISGSSAIGQDILQSQVPAIVINAFQQKYSKARDIDWEKKGDIFEVEFETGVPSKDHKMWIGNTGKVVLHSQEISKSELPGPVRQSIKTQFPGYSADDLVKVDLKGVISYKVDLKKRTEERKVTFNADGKIIGNVPD